MYLRTKLQARAHHNLNVCANERFPGMRVTKGYVVSELLSRFSEIIRDSDKLKEAIIESDKKEEGGGIPINLNITHEANTKLGELKKILDNDTGRSLFPAQIIDILLICAVNCDSEGEGDTISNDLSDKDLAKVLMDFAYQILTEEVHSSIVRKTRFELISVLRKNHLLI